MAEEGTQILIFLIVCQRLNCKSMLISITCQYAQLKDYRSSGMCQLNDMFFLELILAYPSRTVLGNLTPILLGSWMS